VPSKFSAKIRGVGPLYVAIETNCKVPAHLSRAWIKEVNEPYRTGHGYRVRLGHFAFQFGTCTRHPEADVSDDAHMAYLGVRYIPYLPSGGTTDDAPDEVNDEGAGDDEVWAGEPEPVLDHGVVAGGDLPGVQPIRMGTSGERPEDGSEDVNERWRRDYNTQATAQDRQGG
jgi:hypothetical protein